MFVNMSVNAIFRKSVSYRLVQYLLEFQTVDIYPSAVLLSEDEVKNRIAIPDNLLMQNNPFRKAKFIEGTVVYLGSFVSH